MPATDQHQEKLVNDLLLPHDDLRHFRAHVCGEPRDVFHDQDFSLVFFFFKPSLSSYCSSSRIRPSASSGVTFAARLATAAFAIVDFRPLSFQPRRPCTASASSTSPALADRRNCLERVARNRWQTKPITPAS